MAKLPGFHRHDDDDREVNDYYATHPSAIPQLLKILNFNRPMIIREPSSGEGHLSIPLELAGHTVVSSDLVNRGYGIHGVDYLIYNSLFDTVNYDAVIMNPPYKYAVEFIEKSLTQAPLVAAFLPVRFLESKVRERLYETSPPKYVAVFNRRCHCSKNGLFPANESSAVFYAWFIWEEGFKGDPSIRWIKAEETLYVQQTLEMIRKRRQKQSE
jgi:hypothetical protein